METVSSEGVFKHACWQNQLQAVPDIIKHFYKDVLQTKHKPPGITRINVHIYKTYNILEHSMTPPPVRLQLNTFDKQINRKIRSGNTIYYDRVMLDVKHDNTDMGDLSSMLFFLITKYIDLFNVKVWDYSVHASSMSNYWRNGLNENRSQCKLRV